MIFFGTRQRYNEGTMTEQEEMDFVRPGFDEKYGEVQSHDVPRGIVYWPLSLKAFNLEPVDAIILDTIRQHSESYGFCSYTKKTLAFMAGVEEATVFNSLKRLSKKGLVQSVKPTKEERNTHIMKGGFSGAKKKSFSVTSCYKHTALWKLYIERWKEQLERMKPRKQGK